VGTTARRVLAATKREESAGNVSWLWTHPVSVDGVVFLLAFHTRQRLLAFSDCSPSVSALMLLVFSVGVNTRQRPLGAI
jgi:hypothetical protein